MTSLLQAQFEGAVRQLHRPAPLKLLSPGAHKFLIRRFVRSDVSGRQVRAKLFFGTGMEVVLPELVSESIYTYGLFDETVTDLVLQTLRPGDVVLDIGAHFGYFTLLFSHIAADFGRVLAFEPTPSTFSVLKRNTTRRGNVEVFNLAAGERDSQLEMRDFGVKYCAMNTLLDEARMPELDYTGAGQRVKVNVVGLDSFLSSRGIVPDFIKIDAENFEANVVAGLAQTLRNHRPKVLMETGSDNSLRAGEFLVDLGLSPYVSDRLGDLSRWTREFAEANTRYKDILFLP